MEVSNKHLQARYNLLVKNEWNPVSISIRDFISIIGSFLFHFLQAVQAGGETNGGGSTVISWVVDDDNSVVKYCQDNIVTIFVPGSGMYSFGIENYWTVGIYFQ